MDDTDPMDRVLHVVIIEAAIDAMRTDQDERWHAVANVLAGALLAYARTLVKLGGVAGTIANDVAAAVALSRAYLGPATPTSIPDDYQL